MKNIKLLSAKITNFKGIRSFETEFGDVTNIYAYNGLGKSTIADAFFWCLWGKDAQDRKDYEIKNSVHTELNRQDHEVELTFDVDGRHIPVKRVYSEKWTKRRGSNDQELTGHETTLFFDDVPVNLTEFNKRVSAMLDESIFKLITNPLYFNSLHWKDRRKALIDMAGEITNEDVAKGNPAYKDLLEVLKTKTIEDYKVQIERNRKKVQDELKDLPVKIGEAIHGMPEELNWEALEKAVQEKQAEISSIEDQIADKSKALEAFYAEDQKRLAKINGLKSEMQSLKWEAQNKADEANRNEGASQRELTGLLERCRKEVEQNQLNINYAKSQLESLTAKREKLLSDFQTENQKEIQFDEHKFSCPTCKRGYDADDIEAKKSEMVANFNNDKLARIKKIKEDGFATKELIEKKKAELEALETEEEELEIKEVTLSQRLQDELALDKKQIGYEHFLSPEYAKLQATINELEKAKADAPEINTSDLKAQKQAIQEEIDLLKKELITKDQIERSKARIKELEGQERELANEVSRLQGIEFTIQNFINDKMTMIEESINSRFKFVRFKMFHTNINGGTEETCETILDDVLWSSLNTGGRLKAGIDIINAFTEYYQVTAPMILDNRESVFQIPETKSQVINLIASEGDKKLRVEILN